MQRSIVVCQVHCPLQKQNDESIDSAEFRISSPLVHSPSLVMKHYQKVEANDFRIQVGIKCKKNIVPYI